MFDAVEWSSELGSVAINIDVPIRYSMDMMMDDRVIDIAPPRFRQWVIKEKQEERYSQTKGSGYDATSGHVSWFQPT